MSDMTNEEIVAEFEELFGGSSTDDEEQPAEDEVQETQEETDTADEENPEETAEEDQAQDESEDESDSHKETPPATNDNQQSKQNHAFAEQRLQIKKQNTFIRNIAKLIGFDETATLEQIQDKVHDVLLEKEAKDNNISVDVMKRLERAEDLIQENDRIKQEKQVTENLADLIEEHDLSKEDVDTFVAYLIDNNKNPMLDPSVDLKAEYLKLHYKDMVAAAVKEALDKEADRKKKVDEQAASGVSNSVSDKEPSKIESVKDLDDLFNNMDL